jgi:hypothetical protein
MLNQSASVVLDTREAYLVKHHSLLIRTFHALRFTFHEQLGTS